MTVKTTPHINFDGNAREALAFYQSVFGGDAFVITYADAKHVQAPSDADRVMFGRVANDAGLRVMAYDVPAGRSWHPGVIPFFVSVIGDAADEVTGYWDGLSAGATITVPLGPAAWSPLYGMLTDRFGVTWVLGIEGRPAG